MDFYNLVEEARSCRRFKPEPLSEDFMSDLVKIARVCPSTRNSQPLKYITMEKKDLCDDIFPHLRWAGALKDWDGPAEGERPTGYFFIILDKTIAKSAGQDIGIVAQTLQLYASSRGMGCCMLGAFVRDRITEILELEDDYELQLILALGFPAEIRKVCDVNNGNISYYRDNKGIHHVPKRKVEDLIIKQI